jgi:DNA mismatch repair protein MutS2
VTGSTLRILEFHAVLDGVAERASSPLGREAIRGLRPDTDPGRASMVLAAVAETVSFLRDVRDWSPPGAPDARAGIRRLALEGSVLEGRELHALGLLLDASRALALTLDGPASRFPGLASLHSSLYVDPSLRTAIEHAVDADGSVLDSASRDLRRIRSDLRRAHSRIVQQLEAYLRSLPERFVVPDASVALRDGRYVVQVRREGKSEVGGIIHGESATGATLFVEPPIAIRLMNEVQELERAEAREVMRILGEFTTRLLPLRPALKESQETLVHFDTLYGRARMAMEWNGHLPELHAPGAVPLRIVEGRHPLLVLKGEGRVVPFHLDLDPDERAMVVSGPNTGGKSVLLKAIGLIPLLAQSGIIPPVGPGSALPAFRELFADIGDGQSIAESLSTFSAHLLRLREIVEGAGPSSLVLIDEMGTGTDPREGAALARAILEELVRRGALTVATSHLGDLKRLDTPGSGIVNASLQFDPDRIEPTYQLVKGRPGRSYGLAIARRLGFPSGVLDAAEAFRAPEEASVEELLATLERREKEASELVAALVREEAEVTRLRASLEAREADLRERERTAERRAAEEARRVLLEAREEVEKAIAGVRGARAEEVEAEAREARRRVEAAANRQKERAGRKDRRRDRSPAEMDTGGVAPGDRVRLRSGGTVGVLVELRDDRAVVESSGLRLQVRTSDLVRARREDMEAAARESAGSGRRAAWTAPEVNPSWEVHLRGLRMDEMETELERALDAAILGDLPELRIVHGKGTGALRTRVHEILRDDPRVRSFRPGGTGEGGFGVTVARLAG